MRRRKKRTERERIERGNAIHKKVRETEQKERKRKKVEMKEM